jgi:NAD(P)-dependent dehydrogenase (short-subunit alcohol dehydrogenase family)
MTGENKVAVVTGAGSGIGKAAAIALAADGWRIAFAGRREDKLKEAITAAAPGRKSGDRNADSWALAVSTDVTDPQQVHKLFARTVQQFGRVDLLFNNAGVTMPGTPVEDIHYEQWKQIVDTNLTGMFLCIQEAVRQMKNQTPRGGRIINNGSISAHTPRPNSIAYTATKHAVTGLTKCTSLDGRAFDIACGQIDIGNARTELAGSMARPAGVTAEPLMDVELVGRAIAQMAALPLDANVQFMTIMATKMPYIGRG